MSNAQTRTETDVPGLRSVGVVGIEEVRRELGYGRDLAYQRLRLNAWPHFRAGRGAIRFRPEHVAQILEIEAQHAVARTASGRAAPKPSRSRRRRAPRRPEAGAA